MEGEVVGRVRTVAGQDGDHVAGRVTGRFQYARPLGSGSVVASTFGGIADWRLPPQDFVRAGGPVTGPGYDLHQFVSGMLLSQRLEWRTPVPFPTVPIGRWGRSPGRATFAPFGGVVLQEERDTIGRQAIVGYPWAGAALLVFFDLVRIEFARGFRNGRWTFGVDLSRDLWRIL